MDSLDSPQRYQGVAFFRATFVICLSLLLALPFMHWTATSVRANADVRAVSVGFNETCVILKSDGSVWCTPDGETSWTSKDLPWPATEIGSGREHSCALTEIGAVYCWGDNQFGQLGDGTTLTSSVPRRVLGSSVNRKVSQVSVGWTTSCAVLESGAIRCWGNNDSGQLGIADSSQAYSSTWVAPYGFSKSGARQVSVGQTSTCAVRVDGVLFCWGKDQTSQAEEIWLSPKTVTGFTSLNSALSVTVGTFSTCVITSSRGLRCWGDNSQGQLGDGTIGGFYNKPVSPYGFSSGGVRSVSLSSQHTCAIKLNGSVWCWGLLDWTDYGLLESPILKPASVPGLRGSVATKRISSFWTRGYGQTCIVKRNYDVACITPAPYILETP